MPEAATAFAIFLRFRTSSSSASRIGLVKSAMGRARAVLTRSCGVPRHNRAETTVLVSRTNRTPALVAVSFNLGLDLFRCHGRNAGFGDFLGNGKEILICLVACFACQKIHKILDFRHALRRQLVEFLDQSTFLIRTGGHCW